MTSSSFSRRAFLSTTALAAAALQQRLSAADAASDTKGRINHSVCKWCYPKVSLEELCAAGQGNGAHFHRPAPAVRFPDAEKARPHLRDGQQSHASRVRWQDLGGISKAFNRKEHHDLLVQAYEPQIDAVADAGLKNLICFSGNREGMDDETGLKNCAEGLKRVMPLAEKRGVDPLHGAAEQPG